MLQDTLQLPQEQFEWKSL